MGYIYVREADLSVSFIDGFSKIVCIYLIKKESSVFKVFKNFQKLVECKFHKNIITIQSDYGGKYEK